MALVSKLQILLTTEGFRHIVILKPFCTLRCTKVGIEGLIQLYRQSIEAMPYDLLQEVVMTYC